jgi:membrane protein
MVKWGKKDVQSAWRLGVVLYKELDRTRAFVVGAAVAFYMLLALVPLLMVASSMLGLLPIPNLFQQLLDMMSVLAPPEAMAFLKALLASILAPQATRFLSVGVLSYLWASTGCFAAMIDALNIAYDVKKPRPWWRERLQALLLTFTSGGLSIICLLCLLAGPRFTQFLAYFVPLPAVANLLWPPLRLAVMFVTFASGVELLYWLGPNRRMSLRDSLPGATFCVAIWFVGSSGLSYYLDHLANYSATYGSLGAIICLMLWLYLTALAILIGAELNAELIKRKVRRPNLAPHVHPSVYVKRVAGHVGG